MMSEKLKFKTNPHGFIPVNKLSAIVISMNDDEGHNFKVGDRITSKLRLPTTQYAGPKQFDMTGKKFGSLTVIGYWLMQNPKKQAQWVVRCACGYYEIRKRKAIENTENQNDSCHSCRQVSFLGKRAMFLSLNEKY